MSALDPAAGARSGRARAPSPDGTEKQAASADIHRRLGIKTSRDEPLARFTTMRVGGPADLFAEVRNLFELRAIVRFARGRDIPLFLLGRGSDLVISDAGMAGLVVLVRAVGQRIEGRAGGRRGAADGEGGHGDPEAGLSGLEFGLAIPGTVGGAVWANAGAHESDMRGILVEARVVTADGTEAALGPRAGPGLPRLMLKHGVAGRPEMVVGPPSPGARRPRGHRRAA